MEMSSDTVVDIISGLLSLFVATATLWVGYLGFRALRNNSESHDEEQEQELSVLPAPGSSHEPPPEVIAPETTPSLADGISFSITHVPYMPANSRPSTPPPLDATSTLVTQAPSMTTNSRPSTPTTKGN
ncbi:hypothetical protein O9K51_00365 [Purpureocillium lavendulum]|uniref:Uncharacterized protein n=1 Tax=Purpureocillium lavendulum TaxID=1247861 RepID=A0AB34G2K4_9HYPO|nr:hypothetical protein O9K51_00365 [Purpureocillium lavendulum]